MTDIIPTDDAYGALTDEEKNKIKEIQARLDLGNSATIVQYGSGIQDKISDFADTVLSEVRTKDTDYIGKLLGDLMSKMKELHIEGIADRRGISKLPFVKQLFDSATKFMTGYRDISTQIVMIVKELERAKTQLLRDIGTLDGMYDRNIQYYRELNLYILAGKTKLLELQETLNETASAAEQSGDPMQIQKYKDLVYSANRLDGKIHDLVLSRTLSLQTAPQIRLVQNNNQQLAEKIQSSILNTVPLWKNQMVIAITLLRQKNILEVQKGVSETTKGLLERNAQMLKDSTLSATVEAERGIIDIETLKKINADLISTIEETIKIQGEGKERRKQAREELAKIEGDLKDSLLRIKKITET